MPELSLTLSMQFTEDDATSIRAALGRHLQVGKPVPVLQQSIDSRSFIQLLGDVVAWLPLAAPATVFLSTLAKRAADAVWDSTAAWFTKKELKPLSDVATALVVGADRLGGEVRIGVGLNFPDDRLGTVISTHSRDPVEVAKVLSAFIVRAEQISDTMQAVIARGQEPIGPVTVELEDDGSVTIRWCVAPNLEAHEAHIP